MDQPEKCVKIEEARELHDAWKSTRGKYIEDAQGYEDTCEFWYSIEELEQYLTYVKQKSREQGVTNPGIRIYLGAYASTEKEKSFSTVFLAPTMDSSDKSDTDAGDEHPNNYDIAPMNESHTGYPPRSY